MDNKSILSIHKFKSLKDQIDRDLLKSIRKLGLKKLTIVQQKALPTLISGSNCCISAPTGSGKTLAFLIPVINCLRKLEFSSKNGVGALVLSPTREIANQTYDILSSLLTNTDNSLTHVLSIGGTHKEDQHNTLKNGANIVVATPGRILEHFQNIKKLKLKQFCCLVIDEADRMLEMGFRKEIESILEFLPDKRQNILLSATMSKKVANFSKILMKSEKEPIYIDAYIAEGGNFRHSKENLLQSYSICDSSKRFDMLFTFLKSKMNVSCKIMVFFSNCASVAFHESILEFIGFKNVFSIHGNQKQHTRSNMLKKFQEDFSHLNKMQVLLCTDVAARGLDIDDVDWIIQYDCPSDSDCYLHRIGRTSRGVSTKVGNALLILHSSEKQFLNLLKENKIILTRLDIDPANLIEATEVLKKAIHSNSLLNKLSHEAFLGFVKSYLARSNKECFDLNKMNIKKVSESFGIVKPNIADIPIKFKKSKVEKSKNLKKKSL